MFATLLRAIRATFDKFALGAPLQGDDMESYLDSSADLHDLEARQRAWDNQQRGQGLF